jgi:hypothetical protein
MYKPTSRSNVRVESYITHSNAATNELMNAATNRAGKQMHTGISLKCIWTSEKIHRTWRRVPCKWGTAPSRTQRLGHGRVKESRGVVSGRQLAIGRRLVCRLSDILFQAVS